MLTAAAFATSASSHASEPHRPIIVHSALGGQIAGYDVDQNGTEGVLSEWVVQQNGTFIVALETFNQKTGKVKIIKKFQPRRCGTCGDFVTLGVVDTSIGLVERQYGDPYVYKTAYDLLNPLGTNKVNGSWTPDLRKIDNHIREVSEDQGSTTTAVLGVNFNTFESFVFGANIAANTSGPITRLTDSAFGDSNYPVMAIDTLTNEAVVAAGGGGLIGTPEVAIVDLAKGGFTEFTGLGQGEVNGVAVDSADGIACTTTEADWNIEFYDLATETGSSQTLEGATSDLNSGADVQFDPVNKLFLIDQQLCAGQESSTCIQVYDPQGNWIATTKPIAGGFGHIAFNPTTRTGFLWLNDNSKFDELQSFSY